MAIPVLSAQPYVIELDGQAVSHEFHGLGAIASYEKLLYDYPEKERSEIMDLMFKPAYGGALQILKVEIGYDGNNTSSSWPSHQRERSERPSFSRGWGWWLMKEAKKRNPELKLAALHWGYPAWAVTDLQKTKFIFDFVDGAKKQHGLTIDYIGGNQNESVIRPAVTIILRKMLDRAHYKDTRIVVADEGARHGYNVGKFFEKNSAYVDAVDIVGVHYKGRTDPIPDNILAVKKPVWSSEDGGGWYLYGASGTQWADQYIRVLTDIKLSAVIRWQLTASTYDNMAWPNGGVIGAKEPWSGYYKIGGNLWAFAHTTQFTEPGWDILKLEKYRFFSKQDGEREARYIAFKDKSGEDFTVVIVTKDKRFPAGGMDVQIKLSGGLSADSVDLWRSDFNRREDYWFVKQPDIPVRDGSVSLHLEEDCVYTVSTVKSAGKGPDPEIPESRPFPFPYKDDFESYQVGKTAKYFVNANSAFEIAQAAGLRKGKVLRQVVEDAPVPWHKASRHVAQPLTQIGDLEWTDYTVSTDILFEDHGVAALCGRLDGKKEASGDYLLEGYWFFLDSSGKWRLVMKETSVFTPTPAVQYRPPDMKGKFIDLASGKLETGIRLKSWLNVRMTLKGTMIKVYVNDKLLVEKEDSTYSNGSVALGCLSRKADDFYSQTTKYVSVEFDNFSVY